MVLIIALLKKYRELVMYVIFGVLTTLVNIVVFYIFQFFTDYLTSNAIAWILSVAFAYITNRVYVFKSTALGVINIIKELTIFIASRFLSGILDMAIMYTSVDLLYLDDFYSKIVTNVVIIIWNYLFSKTIVFK